MYICQINLRTAEVRGGPSRSDPRGGSVSGELRLSFGGESPLVYLFILNPTVIFISLHLYPKAPLSSCEAAPKSEESTCL